MLLFLGYLFSDKLICCCFYGSYIAYHLVDDKWIKLPTKEVSEEVSEEVYQQLINKPTTLILTYNGFVCSNIILFLRWFYFLPIFRLTVSTHTYFTHIAKNNRCMDMAIYIKVSTYGVQKIE